MRDRRARSGRLPALRPDPRFERRPRFRRRDHVSFEAGRKRSTRTQGVRRPVNSTTEGDRAPERHKLDFKPGSSDVAEVAGADLAASIE